MIPYRTIANSLLCRAYHHVSTWCPGGRMQGSEYVTLNPKRTDKRLGSFKVNLKSGCWADWADGARGRDLISLYAYLNNISNSQAARELSLKL